MKSPFTGGKVRKEQESRILEFRKEQFEVVYHFYVCEDSGEQFTTDELDTLNLNQVYNKYRTRYGIPFTDEIKAVREQYGLSASKMSEVLGLGANVYRNYESGEMPSVATGRFIRLAEDPKEFERLVEMSKNALEPHEYDRVVKKLQQSKNGWSGVENYMKELLFGFKYPNQFNGYRVPQIEKVGNMVRFFAKEIKPFTTALNKLLFYSDFSHFKHHGFSISGLEYKAIQRGPVPANYGILYNQLVNQGMVNIVEQDFGEFVGERFEFVGEIANDFDDEIFSPEEWVTLNKVALLFKGKTTTHIVHMSHDEIAWKDNVDAFDRISYEYGFSLKHID